MKRILTLALVAITLTCCCNKERVVEFPEVSATNSNYLIIEKVELTDSVTKLHIRGYHRPKWWIMINSTTHLTADGQKYEMTGTEGIVADAKLYMPSDGDSVFTLKFAPVPLNTKSLDLIEGPEEDAFKLLGVNLTGKPVYADKKGLPKDIKITPDNVTDLPPYSYTIGETTLNFQILGYNPEYGTQADIYFDDGFTDQNGQTVRTVKFNPKTGKGVLNYTQYGTCRGFIKMNGFFHGTFLVNPGETVDFWLDPSCGDYEVTQLRRTDKPVKEVKQLYSKGSVFDHVNNVPFYNESLLRKYSLDFSKFATNKNLYKLSSEEYIDLIMKEYDQMTEKVDSLALDPITKKIKNIDLRLQAVGAACYGDNYRKSAYCIANRLSLRDPIDYTPDPVTPEQKKMVYKLLDTTDPTIMLSQYNHYLGAVDEKIGSMWKTTYKAVEEAKNGKLPDETLAEMKKWENPFYAQMCEDINNKALAILAEGQKLIQKTPEVPVEELFKAIIAPHKGKTILVDFWNTWCSPCRSAIKENEPFKYTELADSDIVWIYLANETSPIAKYIEMIPDIKGLHYRLNEQQWDYLTEQEFSIDGIPSYVLVKKDGTYSLRNDLRDHNKMLKVLKAEKQL